MTEKIHRSKKREEVRDLSSVVNADRKTGIHVAINQDLTMRTEEVIMKITDTTRGTFDTPAGVVTIVGVNERREEMPHLAGMQTVLLDLTRSNIGGNIEKRGEIRQIPLGEDGMGAAALGKNKMLWVHLAGETSGDITPQLNQ